MPPIAAQRRWCIHPHDPAEVGRLRQVAGVPSLVAELLLARGVSDPATVRDFLDPRLSGLSPPEGLPGCTAAAERIHRAIAAGQRIVIHGDYDVDGMTGTALLWLGLKLLGANVGYYVPHRIDEGYGVRADTLRELAAQQASLVVTVDCGIGAVAEAELARELGLGLVITDHHEPGATLPAADAIVHPRLGGGGFGHFSGAGVAFKLAWELARRHSGSARVSPRLRDFLLQAMGLAALGTVADMVPLLGENRLLVRHGLTSLLKAPTLGVAALLKTAGLADKRALDSEDLSHLLAPRLNAAGRLGQPQLGVELLITDRQERADEVAAYLQQLNENRKTLERSIETAANKQARQQLELGDQPALVLANRGWHAGVIGIVAGKLAERYHRPVVLIAIDQMNQRPAIGSARSIAGFNLHQALAACGHHLVSHGGHAAAAGLKIAEASIDAFAAEFCEYVASELGECQAPNDLRLDGELPLAAFTVPAVRQIDQLAPFGHGNPRPLLCTSGVTLAEPPRKIGKEQQHLSLKLNQEGLTLRAVFFGAGDDAEEIASAGPLDIAFSPQINEYRGACSVQLKLIAWRPARAP